MHILNQQYIKNSNLKRLYSLIYHNEGISRASISKQTKLSKTTVSNLVDDLITREFVVDTGITNSDAIGRKPNGLTVRDNSYYVIVLNWVDTMVNARVMDITGNCIKNEIQEVQETDTYVTVSKKIVYNSFMKNLDANKVLGICVVVSAMIDKKNDEMYSTTLSLSNNKGNDLVKQLRTAFPDYLVNILEDTACYAYAEKVYTQITSPNIAFIHFGRGIGATLFIDNNMIGNASGAVTQFGHYSNNFEGDLCMCGNRGCIETTLSEYYLKKRIKEFGPSVLDNKESISYKDLYDAVTSGDLSAHKLMLSMSAILAQAVANLICIVNPSEVILGGRCPDLGDIYMNMINDELKRSGFRKMVDNTTIRYSSLSPDAFYKGAMKYFFDTYFSFTEKQKHKLLIG